MGKTYTILYGSNSATVYVKYTYFVREGNWAVVKNTTVLLYLLPLPSSLPKQNTCKCNLHKLWLNYFIKDCSASVYGTRYERNWFC